MRRHGDNNNHGQILPSRERSSKSSKPLHKSLSFGTPTWILILIVSCCISFYAGIWVALGMGSSLSSNKDNGAERFLLKGPSGGLKLKQQSNIHVDADGDYAEVCINAMLGGRQEGELAKKLDGVLDAVLEKKIEKALETRCPSNNNQGGLSKKSNTRFPKSVSHYAAGLISVNRKDIFDTYDFGVPMDGNAEHEDVLMLYNSNKALPSTSDPKIAAAARGGGEIPHMDALGATENCDSMNVMFVKKNELTQCVAIVGGQYQGYHLQRWMRVVGEQSKGKIDHNAPLRLTGRYTKSSGYDEMLYPKSNNNMMHQDFMMKYLTNLNKIRHDLDGILKKIAINNTVIVTTVNKGQSELLTNFICSSRARGFAQKNLVVFPTDVFSKELSEGMGLATYFAEELMDRIPSTEAARYGDTTFGLIMMAKVICVQLVSDLGYDILFQDVDVIWLKDPMPFFNSDKAMSNFDLYFQDDGNRQERYAPFSANSGFYYIRNNARTKLLFKTMLYSGDLIFSTRSHQQILVSLLAEANSLTGLKIKVISRDREELPSGYHYHMQKNTFMRKFVKGETDSYIFHMCWTLNKDDKLKFLAQMGMWYVNDYCVGKTTSDILPGVQAGGSVVGACCSAEPLFTCHYSDKASIKPCRDSPAKDKGQKSFW